MEYIIFETPWGHAGACAAKGMVKRIALPSRTQAQALRQLDLPEGAKIKETPELRTLKRFVLDYLKAPRSADPSVLTLDDSEVPTFDRMVYRRLAKIRPGQVITYGGLAAKCGRPGAARAVGRAMSKNPFPLAIPCHRVVKGDGSLGGFSSPEGTALKERLLNWEGVGSRNGRILFPSTSI